MADNHSELELLTTEQKSQLVFGKSFWRTCPVREQSVPSLLFAEGANGLRGCAAHAGIEPTLPSITTVCYPSPSTLACSFDTGLVAQVAQAIACEARRARVSCLLGPFCTIVRHPLAGNISDCYGEDPLVCGSMCAAFVEGAQSAGVGVALHGFSCCNQQHGRLTNIVAADERALREVHMRPFEIALRKARPWAVLATPTAAFSTIDNGRRNMLSVLRQDWGYDGAVLTEWGGIDDAAQMLESGIDISMPGPDDGRMRALAVAAERDAETAKNLDRAAESALKLARRHQDAKAALRAFDDGECLELAHRAAEESIVLLKNESALPLSTSQDIAFVGCLSKRPVMQEQGQFARVDALAGDCVYDAFVQAGCKHVAYAQGYDEQTGRAGEADIEQAVELSRVASCVVVVAGPSPSGSVCGPDKASMRLPDGQDELIERVCAQNDNVIVVLMGTGPFELGWRASANAILCAGLAGCQGGHALADVLLGVVSPSGKLAMSWPCTAKDSALGERFPDRCGCIPYTESIYVGYRYYVSAGIPVAYSFGHGLTYTRFEYLSCEMSVDNDEVILDVTVKNTGERYGAEVVQVYLSCPDHTAFMPKRWLAGFQKVVVAPDCAMTARIVMDARAFSHWDIEASCWKVEKTRYEILIGSSSDDVRLREHISLEEHDGLFHAETIDELDPIEQQQLESYFEPRADGFTAEEFGMLFGRALPQPERGGLSTSTVFGDIPESRAASAVKRRIVKRVAKEVGAADEAQTATIEGLIEGLPLRALTLFGLTEREISNFARLLNALPSKSPAAR